MMILFIKIGNTGARTHFGEKDRFNFEFTVFEALEEHIGKDF